MPVLPSKKNEIIQFAEGHLPVWSVAPATIGLSPAQIATLTTASTAARTTFDEALTARLAAKAATVQSDVDVSNLHSLLSEAIKAIRLYAETTNNPAVYAEAQIPPPAAPTPAKPPTEPVELRAIIGSMGQLTIQWKAAAATPGLDDSTVGVLYTVRRRLAGEPGFTYIGTASPSRAGKRGFSSYTDDSLPLNPSGLQYVVQGVRSTSSGNLAGPASDVFSITLGLGGDGTMFVQASSTEKLAA